jgi:hypothetical protein
MKYMDILKKRFSSYKIVLLFLITVLFTLLYMLLDDSHFSGLNKIQETIKDELIKKKLEHQVDKAIVENFVKENDVLKNIKIDQATRNVERKVDSQDLSPENIEPSVLQKFFNRLYFSISTSTLLGFGDIYPVTNISKTFVMMQSISTLILIIL